MESNSTNNEVADRGWVPFTLDHLLTNHKLTKLKTILLLLLWIGLIAVSMFTVYYTSPESWVSGVLDQSAIYSYFMFYPPLLIGILLLFWFGFEWGFIPIFLATFVIAFATQMPFYWAILFGLAFVLGLGIYALAYYCVPADISLRSLKSFAFFVVVACVASIASSLGSFIWSFAHDMSVAQSMILWRGWWTGVLFQSLIIIAPALFFLTPIVQKLKTRFYAIPQRSEVTLNWIYGAILSVAAVLSMFVIGAHSLGVQLVDGLASAIPVSPPVQIIQAVESIQVITWISIGLVLSLGLGGIYLVGTWNKSLSEEVDNKTAALKSSQEKLKSSLEDKNLLIDGIHQRMRNNLTIILALLELQVKNNTKKNIDDLLRDSHSRLGSLALVHETMYQAKTVDSLNMKLYAIKLTNRLHQSHKYKNRNIDITINSDDLFIDLERAMPFAMILNELLSNAYVHAFDEATNGVVQVMIDRDSEDYIIEVKDNGRGLPTNLDEKEKQHLGLKLVKLLVSQMHGTFEITDYKKSTFRITFPLESTQTFSLLQNRLKDRRIAETLPEDS